VSNPDMSQQAQSPKGARPISLEDLDNLAIDDQNNLYWRGRIVRTAQQWRLFPGQGYAGWLTALGAFLAGLGTFIEKIRPLF
jgi:hypothetical protein